jgi:shikimate kinase
MSTAQLAPIRILLVGMMGSGKTTTGALLARRLGWSFLDSDAEIEKATGKTVPEILEESGEPAFRAEEKAVLEAALSIEHSVVAVAGGAVLDSDSAEKILASGLVVWLRADPETLARRVGDGRGRPLLGNDPGQALRRLDAVRRPLYEALASIVVDVDDLAPAAVAAAVVDLLQVGEAP